MKKWSFLLFAFLFAALSYAQKPTRVVEIGLFVNDISRIDPQEETFSLDATLKMKWELGQTFKKDRYYYGSEVNKALTTIWGPYYKFSKTRGKNYLNVHALSIKKDGKVSYEARLGFSIETDLNLHRFPFDRQNIVISVTPFGERPYKIKYRMLEDFQGFASDAHLDEWDAVSSKFEVKDNNIYQLDITYHRLPAYYIYKIFSPLVVIIFIAYLVLWLPKQPAINRLSVIITSFLTIVAFQWAIGSAVPKVAYMTYLQAMLLFSYITVGSKAVIIVVGEALSKEGKMCLMWHARWIYPVLITLGVLLITYGWLF